MTTQSRARLDEMSCPIARSLGAVGDAWSMLIVRDVLRGRRRFDELQSHLGIATNLLSDRLRSLVQAGMLDRRRYSEHPPRHEYHATDKALDFQPVLFALLAWGNRHCERAGQHVVVVDRETGDAMDPILVDAATGRRLNGDGFTLATMA